MEAVDVRGRFMWHQLFTHDAPGAKDFYTSLVGWKAQAWPPDPRYTVCHAGDVPAAGIIEFAPDMPAESPPHWLPYIGTRDVDSVAEAAVRAGGSIVKEPGDLKGAGRYAVLKDPQGAVFAIIDPENARPEENGMPPLGHFSWHELATSDAEAAFSFYSELFGWDAITRMDMGSNVGVYLIFGKDGAQKGGMYLKCAEMPAPPHWLSYAVVPDVDASVAVVESGGGKIIQPPMEVPGGSRITILLDPSGAAFALNSMPSAQVAPVHESTPQLKAKAKPKAKAKAKAKPKAKAKAKPKVAPKVKVKAKSRPAGKAKSKPKSKGKSKAAKKPHKKASAARKKTVKKSARRKK